MNRTYELMFIVRPDMVEEDLRQADFHAGDCGDFARAGTMKSEKMGKRRLAYIVRRFHDGIFVLPRCWKAAGGLIHELERRLRVTEPVIKFITVRIDEEQKRLDKIKKIRDRTRRRAPRRPATGSDRKRGRNRLRQVRPSSRRKARQSVGSWFSRSGCEPSAATTTKTIERLKEHHG